MRDELIDVFFMRITQKINYEKQAAAAMRVSTVVKMTMGVCNNATFLILLDAHDAVSKTAGYKTSKAKKAFTLAMKAWREYERRLRTATVNRMFRVCDMPEHHRRKYGNISDAEYFEYWQGFGYSAYKKTRPLVTSLWNKFRLSLINHSVGHPDEMAWVLTAQAALDLCTVIFEGIKRTASEDYGLLPHIAKGMFEQFSVKDVAERWSRAIKLLNMPEYTLEEIEARNIQMGVDQLYKAWTDWVLTLESYIDTVDDYSEVFATAGYADKEKRTLRQFVADMKYEQEQ